MVLEESCRRMVVGEICSQPLEKESSMEEGESCRRMVVEKESSMKEEESCRRMVVEEICSQPLEKENSMVKEVVMATQYIIQHFAAATGCKKLAKNTFVTGKITMNMVNDPNFSAAVGTASHVSHKGCFVMWQMLPEKWKIAWRYTPCLGDRCSVKHQMNISKNKQEHIN
ncbi:hypothetical protein AALP_AA8G063100 [Arabis alpina]|uniref:Uncharacterized protein n=1 Tax=Arabis alpina TaxID=50452 RepID=A0A087G5C5_ARAAL|nr:hypothetical protein AALP_AA8G063100 [Arabis alpina]